MNIVDYLYNKNLTLSSAESFTGGGFGNYITNIPGSSKVYKGGIISYFTSIKEKVLNINKDIINSYGVISKQTAEEMADNSLTMFNSDISISFTGNAGPTASENKEVGLIYIALASKSKSIVNEYHLKGSREDIKKQAIEIAVKLILENV